jgi:hypothetical protein
MNPEQSRWQAAASEGQAAASEQARHHPAEQARERGAFRPLSLLASGCPMEGRKEPHPAVLQLEALAAALRSMA